MLERSSVLYWRDMVLLYVIFVKVKRIDSLVHRTAEGRLSISVIALFGMRAMELTLQVGVPFGDGSASLDFRFHYEMGVDPNCSCFTSMMFCLVFRLPMASLLA